MKLDEILSKPLPFKVLKSSDGYFRVDFKAGDREIIFDAENEGALDDVDEGIWLIAFGQKKPDNSSREDEYFALDFEKTGSGNEFEVFATIKAILERLIKEKNVKEIHFDSDKNDQKRGRVYQRMIGKNLPSGWKLAKGTDADGRHNLYDKYKIIKEALDKPLPYEVILRGIRSWIAVFKVEDRKIQFEAEFNRDGSWSIMFGEVEERDGSHMGIKLKKTGKGNEFQIFATVKAILDEFIKDKKPWTLELDSHKGEPSRAKLYQRMIAKNLPPNWEMERDESHSTYTTFKLKRS